MSKMETVGRKAEEHSGFASFARAEVVAALGENPKLRDSFYVRRCHILKAYGVSHYRFAKLVKCGVLKGKFFD